MKRLSFAMIVAACFCWLAPTSSIAQHYPNRPISIVIGFGPGSGVDVLARAVAERLAESMKNPVVVLNREGAGGTIGRASVAKAAPDGYTLLLGGRSTLLTLTQEALAYETLRDFAPVVKLAEIPLLMITSNSAPYRTLPELVAYARQNPGKLSYATSGKGSPSHLGVEFIRQAMGIAVTDVPYKNVGQAMTDALAGHVAFYFPAISAALPQVKAGKARGLAIGSVKRSAQAPQVPTVAEELGVQGLEYITWYGLLAPAGTPREIIARLAAENARAMQGADLRERLMREGFDIAFEGPETLEKLIQDDIQRFPKLVKDLRLND